ncbi:hypothetical protein H4582DRAFT_2063435 [Lactarius indigo]|nr:hypothetical protein H4582DRAFT_2063435 [Lactarius indigo]
MTRTSIAFDIERNSVIFFKDSWRVTCDGMEREGNIYKTLNNVKIPNVPHCAASSDVGVDTYHSTSHRDAFEKSTRVIHLQGVLARPPIRVHGSSWWQTSLRTPTSIKLSFTTLSLPSLSYCGWLSTISIAVGMWTAYLASLTVFNPHVYGNTGGLTKLMFMCGDQELNKLNLTDNVPLVELLRNLKELLSIRHRDRPTYAHKFKIKDVIHQAQGIKPTLKLAAVNEQAFKNALADYELYMSALDNHNAAILTIKQVINQENAWPAFEPANRQRLLLSHAVRRGLHSGSKRCREAALECEGGDLMERQSLPKRNKNLPK